MSASATQGGHNEQLIHVIHVTHKFSSIHLLLLCANGFRAEVVIIHTFWRTCRQKCRKKVHN